MSEIIDDVTLWEYGKLPLQRTIFHKERGNKITDPSEQSQNISRSKYFNKKTDT